MNEQTLKETIKLFNMRKLAELSNIKYSTLKAYSCGARSLSANKQAQLIQTIKEISNRL